jgi:hypothetical protein
MSLFLTAMLSLDPSPTTAPGGAIPGTLQPPHRGTSGWRAATANDDARADHRDRSRGPIQRHEVPDERRRAAPDGVLDRFEPSRRRSVPAQLRMWTSLRDFAGTNDCSDRDATTVMLRIRIVRSSARDQVRT